MLTLPPVATLAQAQQLLGQLGDAPELVDASALAEFDTSAIALLLEASRRAAAAGKTLRIESPPAQLVGLARLYGVAALLGLEPAAA